MSTERERDPAVAALRRAVLASPADLALRLHLAQVLLAGDRSGEAVTELSAVLAADSQHPGAIEPMFAGGEARQTTPNLSRLSRPYAPRSGCPTSVACEPSRTG